MSGWMQYAACYSVDLYCRNTGIGIHFDGRISHSGQYTGETFGECAREARKDGWVIHRDRTATCPHCNKKSRRGR